MEERIDGPQALELPGGNVVADEVGEPGDLRHRPGSSARRAPVGSRPAQ